MKKFFVLMLALLMALQLPAFAAMGISVYTDPDTGYQLPYPELWNSIDRASIDAMIEKLASGELVIEGMNTDSLTNLKNMMHQLPIVVFQSPIGGDNFNIYYVDDSSLANSTIEQFLAESGENVRNGLKSTFVEFTPLDPGSLITAGENTYARFSGEGPLQGRLCQMHQLYLLKGERMYIITFTFFPGEGENLPENLQHILDQVTAGFVPA
ncbi:MAG: hypothetical protein ACOYI6_10635 [Christensenellales bacterium]